MDSGSGHQGPTSRFDISSAEAGAIEDGWRGEATSRTDEVVATAAGARAARSWLARCLWFAVGWLAVAVGGIGVVVPGLPTTGFMIIAAACFARSSPRFEQWVLHLPVVGRSVADYRSGAGMPKRAKVAAVSMMVVAISISVGLLLDNIAVRVSIVAAGLIGTWYIVWRIPTAQRSASAPSST